MIRIFLVVVRIPVSLPIIQLQPPKDQPTESFEKSVLRLLNQGDQNECRELEKNLRYVTYFPLILWVAGIKCLE